MSREIKPLITFLEQVHSGYFGELYSHAVGLCDNINKAMDSMLLEDDLHEEVLHAVESFMTAWEGNSGRYEYPVRSFDPDITPQRAYMLSGVSTTGMYSVGPDDPSWMIQHKRSRRLLAKHVADQLRKRYT